MKKKDSVSGKKPKFSLMEIYATFVAAFSFLCIGILRAYTSPAISSMKRNPEIFNTTIVSEKEAISWFASSPPLASFFGTIVAGPLLQYCGRQKTLIYLTIPCILGWALIGFSVNIVMAVVGRMLTGFSAGISTASAQLFVSEFVRPEVRGSLGFVPSMMLALGVLVGFGACTINVEWRSLALIMSSFPIVLFFMALSVPESPPWLILRGRVDQATKAMQKFRGPTSPKEEIDDEISALKSNINKRRASRLSALSKNSHKVVSFKEKVSNFLKILSKREIWLPASIAVSLMMFQQFSAANVVIFFLSIILTDAEPLVLQTPIIAGNNSEILETALNSYTVLDHNVGAVIVGLVQFAAFFLSLPLIDRMGRKILLIVSAILMSFSFSILGFYFYCNLNSQRGNFFGDFVIFTYSWLPLTCLCLFIASYSIGLGPIPFILMSEIFPAKGRSYLCALSSFSNHFFLFIIIKMFPKMVEWIGNHFTFWIFSGFSLLSILLVIQIQETKGKTLHQIEMGFIKEAKPLLIDRRDSYAVGLP